MRDPKTTEAILTVLRDLLVRDPGISFGALIHGAAKFAVSATDVLNISDEALLRALRARSYRKPPRQPFAGVVSAEQLAAMDEAWDERSTFADAVLRKELQMIRDWLASHDEVSIFDGSDTKRLTSLADFEAWRQERYPERVIAPGPGCEQRKG